MDADAVSMVAAAPPTLQPCQAVGVRVERDPVLVWVDRGTAHVRLAGGERFRIDAGSGVWFPPGADHDMWTEDGTLAFPTSVPCDGLVGAPEYPLHVSIDGVRRDWLIELFAQSVAPPTSSRDSRSDLVRILGPHRKLPAESAGCHVGAGTQDRRPPFPRSSAARAVAQALMASPRTDASVEEWAALVSCSARTLRRAFLRDTGLTFVQWRTQCRLAVAADRLVSGEEVTQVAAHVGFGSRQWFTRAFTEVYTMSPREFAAARRSSTTPVARSGEACASGGTKIASHMSTSFSVLHWAYRGTGLQRVDREHFRMSAGDALWVPRGQEYEAQHPPGSIEVPIVVGCHDALEPGVESLHFPESWSSFLLHASVRSTTLLYPEGFDCREIIAPLNEQLAVDRARKVLMPSDPQAKAAASQILRGLAESDGSTRKYSREVRDAFQRDTGLSLESWRFAARMRLARELLARRHKGAVVATRVGYAHLSNFSSEFSRFHGVSPREWRERELEERVQ